MSETTWGDLSKAIGDNTKISEEIDADMLAHNEDPSAHGQSGEALDTHRIEIIIDHPDASVTEPKIADGAVGSKIVFVSSPTEVLIDEGISAAVDWTDIDLSADIPTSAKAVIVQLWSYDQNGKNTICKIRGKGQTDAQGYILSNTNLNGLSSMLKNQGIVKVGTNRCLQYAVSSVAGMDTAIYLYLVGYIK